MKSLSGAILNINAEKAFVIFPKGVTSKRRVKPVTALTSGGSEQSMSKNCQAYVDGKITRKELVSSLAAYLGE